MGLEVLYFAGARDAAGTGREALSERPATVGALREILLARHPALARVLPRCRIAVGDEFAADNNTAPSKKVAS